MSRVEDQIKDSLDVKKPIKAAISIAETIVSLGMWVLVSQFTILYIIEPIFSTNPQKFVREMNFSTYILIFTCLLPLSCLFLWRGFVQKINPFSTVSYTHLDVYKRQGFFHAAQCFLSRVHGAKDIFANQILCVVANPC